MIYSLETRSYSLLLLGAVGLTAATLRASLAVLAGTGVGSPLLVTWTGWGLLASTTHLFGAVLTVGAAAVLVVLTLGLGRQHQPNRQDRRSVRLLAVRWVLLATIGCSLQTAWLAHGITRPGFAAGTGWIPAPGGPDVWDLVTTTFSSGSLTPHRSGFAWTSPVGAVVAFASCAAALVYRLVDRVIDRTPGLAESPSTEAPAGAILLGLVLVVAAPVFAVSQWTQLWTLRNMAVIAPALAWGTICVAASGGRTTAGRNRVASAVVLLLGLGLVPTTTGLVRPYKTDFRGLFRELTAIRAQDPDARFTFVGPAPVGWGTADRGPGQSAVWSTPYGRLITAPPARSTSPDRPADVTIVYRSVADPDPDVERAALVERAVPGVEPRDCRQLSLHGLGLVRCRTASRS